MPKCLLTDIHIGCVLGGWGLGAGHTDDSLSQVSQQKLISGRALYRSPEIIILWPPLALNLPLGLIFLMCHREFDLSPSAFQHQRVAFLDTQGSPLLWFSKLFSP